MARRFGGTARFASAVALINRADVARFPLILSRALSRLHARGERVFSDSESAQLCELLGLNGEELVLLIDACCYVFETAAAAAASPVRIRDELLKAGADEPHALSFMGVWEAEAGAYVAKLKDAAVVAPLVRQSRPSTPPTRAHARPAARSTSPRSSTRCASAPPRARARGCRPRTRCCSSTCTRRAPTPTHRCAPLPPPPQSPPFAPRIPLCAQADQRSVQMQLSAAQLEGLLQKLDTIQGQLDRLQ